MIVDQGKDLYVGDVLMIPKSAAQVEKPLKLKFVEINNRYIKYPLQLEIRKGLT